MADTLDTLVDSIKTKLLTLAVLNWAENNTVAFLDAQVDEDGIFTFDNSKGNRSMVFYSDNTYNVQEEYLFSAQTYEDQASYDWREVGTFDNPVEAIERAVSVLDKEEW